MSPDSIINTAPTATPPLPPTMPVVPPSPQPPTKERKLLIVAIIAAASLAVIALVTIVVVIVVLKTTPPPPPPPPTPEPELVAPKPSSKFATDAAILQIRLDAKTVLGKLDSLDFSEPEITPPSLDLHLNIPSQL